MTRAHLLTTFLVAFAISALWTYFNRYEYVGANSYLFGHINTFPLILWTIGLTLLSIVHARSKGKYRFLRTTLIYLICISALEAVGYHILGIRLNSNEPSLFHLGIIHAPLHMKIFYLTAGPLYILLTDTIFPRKSSVRDA